MFYIARTDESTTIDNICHNSPVFITLHCSSSMNGGSHVSCTGIFEAYFLRVCLMVGRWLISDVAHTLVAMETVYVADGV